MRNDDDEEDPVAAAQRRIEETLADAERTFRRAQQKIDAEPSTPPRPSRLPPSPPLASKFDAGIAEMSREVWQIRASARASATLAAADDARESRAPRARLRELEENLRKLARSRDKAAELAAEWERRAMQAVAAGNGELALAALARKKEHDRTHQTAALDHDYRARALALLRELVEAVEAAQAVERKPSDNG